MYSYYICCRDIFVNLDGGRIHQRRFRKYTGITSLQFKKVKQRFYDVDDTFVQRDTLLHCDTCTDLEHVVQRAFTHGEDTLQAALQLKSMHSQHIWYAF